MRLKHIASIFLFLTSISAIADEGMWLPSLVEKLNLNKMHQLGCNLSADEIYNINNSSLKDAVVALNHGSCTGELISEEGLMLTNHHCGYGEIQSHSTLEHDYLKNGFWAMSREEELPNPGKSVSFLIRIEDITSEIAPFLNNEMTEQERNNQIIKISSEIKNKATKDTHYEAMIKEMFSSNNFYLFVYETFRDVRLVGCPPSSIGRFGGDTDNWMWPRHTGDFCLFRIYCGPDGKPADFSENNVPYHPKHHLPISIKGYDEYDFAMIMGYPGRTSRYITSHDVKYIMEVKNPTRVEVRSKKLDILKKHMRENDKVRIQYASKYARSSNYWKYSIGQNKGLSHLKIREKKKAQENEFLRWINTTDSLNEKYGMALPLIAEAYKNNDTRYAKQLIIETMIIGPELYRYTYNALKLEKALRSHGSKDEVVKTLVAKQKEKADKFYKNFNGEIDLKIAIELTEEYFKNAPSQYHPSFFKDARKKSKGDFADYLEKAYSKSFFLNQDRYNEFLDHPKLKKLTKDPIYKAGKSIYDTYQTLTHDLNIQTESLNKGHRLYMAGLMEMQKDRLFYPDANSSMRLTYGSVKGYKPRDGVDYMYYTTIEGYLEKENPGNPEFYVTPRMKELITNKDWGRYANNEGTIPTCFITNNDITGGNSGSPVINGNGELIGIAFDGNWEAMSGDIAFENDMQRCISVDTRFILWVIDKYAGATHLIDEMTIIE